MAIGRGRGLLAYRTACARETDVDKARDLGKSPTVEQAMQR